MFGAVGAASDLMQDFRTGYLTLASAKVPFSGCAFLHRCLFCFVLFCHARYMTSFSVETMCQLSLRSCLQTLRQTIHLQSSDVATSQHEAAIAVLFVSMCHNRPWPLHAQLQ